MYSYGKHCDGFQPGENVELKGKSSLEVFKCPDRTDCSQVNGDAILMAGYLCHPCIPNPCQYQQNSCLDLLPYSGQPGFQCTSDIANARDKVGAFSVKPTSPVHPNTNAKIIGDTNSAPALKNPVDVKFHP